MAGNLPTHNLKAVIHETGLTPATLRAWERRYGLFKPQRSPGGHRLYSQNEIELLKWLVARQSEGLSISQAVQLWRNQQDALPSSALDAQSAPAVALDTLRAAWVAACAAFDEQGAERTLAQAFAIASPESVCTDLLQKGLSEIGEGWYAGKITIQQEHFASALAMRRLQALYHATPQPVRPGRILAACPPGEMHEFSLLLLSYLLRRRGWDVIYLGVNVPFEQLGATIRQVSPHLLLSIAQTLGSAADLRQMANAALDQGIVLAFGGGIFNLVPGLAAYIPGHFLGNRMEDVPQAVETFLLNPPALPLRQELSPDLRALLAEFQARSVLITASVTAALQHYGFAPAHLEEANTNFTYYLIAAIKLGDFQILDHTVAWLEGLLKNYGLPPEIARHYFGAYAQAVRQYLSGRAAPILAWLDRFSAA